MQYKKSILILLFLLVCTLTVLQAQTAVPASGGNASGPKGSASYSAGQVVYTTITGNGKSVAQGVQQPFEIMEVSSIEEAKGIKLSVLAYPNPTSDFLTLEILNEVQMQYIASLYDISGKLLQKTKITNKQTSIAMSNYKPATYFLKVSQGNKEIKVFKIIKN
jgi:hypothetical protein